MIEAMKLPVEEQKLVVGVEVHPMELVEEEVVVVRSWEVEVEERRLVECG